MSTILAFDTSGPYCAAALLEGDTVLARACEDMAKGQAERLMPLLEDVLAEAGKDWQDLDRIGVGIGPGNFTGIRIAVSAARGLALSLSIPAIGVSALEAQAYGRKGTVISTLDARQDRMYLEQFQDGIGQGPQTVSLGALPPLPSGDCIGFQAAKTAQATGGTHADGQVPVAEAIARLAAARAYDGSRPAPLYLRPADAAPPRDAAPVIL